MTPDREHPQRRGDRGTDLGGSTRLLTRLIAVCIRLGRAAPRLVRAVGRPFAATFVAIGAVCRRTARAITHAASNIGGWARRHRRSVVVAAIALAALLLFGAALVVPGAAQAGGSVVLGLGILAVGGVLVFGAAAGLVVGGRWLGRVLRDPSRRLGAMLRSAARAVFGGFAALVAPIRRVLASVGRAAVRFFAAIGHSLGVVLSTIGHVLARCFTTIGHVLAGCFAGIGRALARVLSAIGAVLGTGLRAVGWVVGTALGTVGRAFARLVAPIVGLIGAALGRAGHLIARAVGAVARWCAPMLDAVARKLDQGFATLGRVARRGGRALVGTTRRVEHAVGVAIVKARLQTRAEDHAAALVEARAVARDRPASALSVPFRATVDQNEFLFRDATEVHAIVTVDADAGPASIGATIGAANGNAPEPETATVILLDCSGSMGRPWSRLRAAQRATAASVESLRNGSWFAIVRATDEAEVLYPPDGHLVPATPDTRRAAIAALRLLWPEGGTAMGTWLRLARTLVDDRPSAIARAILLTDGRDESETRAELDAALRLCTGRLQCDCRGIGTDWAVDELRTIATRTLGTVDIVADPDDLEADFLAMTDAAMSKHVGDARLRVWTPRGARVRFVKQVSPSIEDLTTLRRRIDDRTSEYPTGSWGTETRDYHVCIEVPRRGVGEEMLAARVTLEVGSTTASKALIRAIWTADEERATRITPRVAHATGQAELADLIQDGLARRRAGDATAATDRLGRALALAAASGNEHTLRLLQQVVDVEADDASGSVRFRADAELADEMALDARSSKTTRLV